MNMVKKIGMVIVGATLVVAHCLIGGTALAATQENGQPCPPECVTDSMEIITYYPSPYGYYEELRGDKIIVGDSDNSYINETDLPPPGTITFEPQDESDLSGSFYESTMYYDKTAHEFKYYDENSQWKALGAGGGEYWKPSGATGRSATDIYYDWSGDVGIGVGESDTIGAKLLVNPEYGQIGFVVKKGSETGGSVVQISTPGIYTYKVPPGIFSLKVIAYGASGGDGGSSSPAGKGGRVTSTITVTPEEILYINVGGKGNGSTTGGGGGGGGGSNGGGRGGNGYLPGYGGGGASDVRQNGDTLGHRVVVAGGGGGAGGVTDDGNHYKGGSGGSGGGFVGGNGYIGNGTPTAGSGGSGGSDSGGGSGGGANGGDVGINGGSGYGGRGGDGARGGSGGGGGGGGYYGGGGGGGGGMDDTPDAGGGGGGGSSYAIGSNILIESGIQSGDGKVLISYNLLYSGPGRDNLTEWQDENGSVINAVDLYGNLALGASSANGYKLYVNGSAYVTSGAWTASDLRFKENILPLNNSLDKILNIQPVSFDWNKSGYPDMNFDPNRQIGLVAQEVEKQIPELVHTDINGYKAVAYDKLTAVLVEAVKEQQAQMRNQQKKIEILELKLKELDNKK